MTHRHHISFGLLTVVILLFCASIGVQAAPSANEIMRKAAATLTSSSGVTVEYSLSGSGRNSSGTVIMKGSAFFLDMGRYKTWYDGRTMTTLDNSEKTATLSTPSAAEVNEALPLSYISQWSRDYRVALAPKQPSSGYCLILTSKSSSATARKAVLTVSANFRPSKLVVSLKNGRTATLTVRSITIGGSSAASHFRFPTSKYPKVKIIDLR